MSMLLRKLAVVPIRLYQYCISPVLPPSCRYYPSCSAYAVEAVMRHGILRGGWLTICRLARCHPWAAGGVDPVPPPTPKRRSGVQELLRRHAK
ncbi:MAG: membrane protein insertion efficiency factor YidD [Desulfovibrionaceae bacterium]|nr:membrane protein insertion efficiency factor YidD [Desulfovibrionaceae bacterium]